MIFVLYEMHVVGGVTLCVVCGFRHVDVVCVSVCGENRFLLFFSYCSCECFEYLYCFACFCCCVVYMFVVCKFWVESDF